MKKVLVIDDDDSILYVVSAILSKGNFSTYKAINTEIALRILNEESIDLILLDIVLPGQGGMEFLMDIRKILPATPVILMSGKVRTDLMAFKKLAKQFGAVEILSKPFTAEELLQAVHGIIPREQFI